MTQGVIVTGAGDSVGRIVAERFLAEGLAVHISDIRKDVLDQTLADNPGMSGSHGNLAEKSDVEQLYEDARANFSQLYASVNCVGIGGPRGLTEELSDEEWRTTFDVNVHGVLYSMQRAIHWFKSQNTGGAIVNFSSGSTRTRLPARSAYIASKYAVEGLTLNAARELGPFGIRCNAILPGIIDNPRMTGIIAARAQEEGREAEDVEAEYLQYISMRSKVQPSELADSVQFLCSDSGKKITGELLSVSGNLEWEA